MGSPQTLGSLVQCLGPCPTVEAAGDDACCFIFENLQPLEDFFVHGFGNFSALFLLYRLHGILRQFCLV